MTISNGWVDWAQRVPGPSIKVNGGINPVHGVVLHSAEGYQSGLLSQLAGAPVSWHFSVLYDGTLWQHYPITAQCWHATAFNNFTIGVEHEGVGGQPFNDLQLATDKKLIAELSAYGGWSPKRPTSKTDLTATLWEHNEVTRLKGGTGSTCPNGRIPWDKILTKGYGPMWLNADGSDRIESEGKYIIIYQDNVPVFRIGGDTPGQLSKLFGDKYYYMRTTADGTVKYSDQPGD